MTSNLQPLTNYKGVLFCPLCGVYVSGKGVEGENEESDGGKGMEICQGLGKMRVNVRCFEALSLGEVKVEG